jgi:hypothetical protein
MRAAILTAYGDVDKIELRDAPQPVVEPNAIKVRVAAAGINPVDWKMRTGAAKAMMPHGVPTILGRDASGEVVEVGAATLNGAAASGPEFARRREPPRRNSAPAESSRSMTTPTSRASLASTASPTPLAARRSRRSSSR